MGIVTLPCSLAGYRAARSKYGAFTATAFFLATCAPKWNGYAPVTDAGKTFCHYCHARYGNKRVVCCETMGWRWHELVHEDGAYKGTTLYNENVPFRVWAALDLRNASGG